MLKWHIYVVSRGPHVFLVVSPWHAILPSIAIEIANPDWLKQPSLIYMQK